jgi:hypothetical protein
VKACKEWDLQAKSLLKAYPELDGSMVKTKHVKGKKLFRGSKFRELLHAKSCELINRPPMGLHLLASTVEHGAEVLKVLKGGGETCLDGAHGIVKKLLPMFKQLQHGGKQTKDDTKVACEALFEAMLASKGNESETKVLAEVAEAAALVWGVSSGILEVKALLVKN